MKSSYLHRQPSARSARSWGILAARSFCAGDASPQPWLAVDMHSNADASTWPLAWIFAHELGKTSQPHQQQGCKHNSSSDESEWLSLTDDVLAWPSNALAGNQRSEAVYPATCQCTHTPRPTASPDSLDSDLPPSLMQGHHCQDPSADIWPT